MSDVLVAELADRGENPAEAPYDCRLEVDTEEHHAIIVWTEALAFHAGYNGPAKGWYTSGEDDWAPLVDANGWLTDLAQERLEDELERIILQHVDSPTLKVGTVERHDDEPSITFVIITDYAEGETYQAWLDRIGWPVIATLINVTDPGTFNSPYLFSASNLREA